MIHDMLPHEDLTIPKNNDFFHLNVRLRSMLRQLEHAENTVEDQKVEHRRMEKILEDQKLKIRGINEDLNKYKDLSESRRFH